MLSSVIFAGSAFSQSVVVDESQGIILTLDIGLMDLQEIDRWLQDYEVLKDLDRAKDERIVNLERDVDLARRELDLEKRENELNVKIIGVKDLQIAAQNLAFQDMKEVADRAIKLAETAKPKTNWSLLGWIATIVAAIAVGAAL
jgi:hypothetical protein